MVDCFVSWFAANAVADHAFCFAVLAFDEPEQRFPGDEDAFGAQIAAARVRVKNGVDPMVSQVLGHEWQHLWHRVVANVTNETAAFDEHAVCESSEVGI